MDPIEYVTTSAEFAPLWAEVRRRLGLNAMRAAVLRNEFVRALSVKALDSPGGMPADLDAVWHEVVLNTRHYAALCQRLRGTFVHHSTESEAPSGDDVARRSRVDATVLAYRKRYREEPEPSVWDEDDVCEPLSHVFVKGMNGKTVKCGGLNPHSTISQLKAVVQSKTGIAVDQQRLIYAGVQLPDEATCGGIGLQNDATVHLVERIRGC